jgi:adenosyl cobinamide kinase/adenosyl cobinamide phosphate guanylyltransferase
VLVLGGTRSGKSGYAEGLLPADAPVRYLATARRWPGDAEWDARITAHRARRPAAWTTVEEPDVPAEVRAAVADVPLLVDDLATWLTGVLDDAGAWDRSGPDGGRTISPVDRAERSDVSDVVGARVAALVDAVALGRGQVVLVSAEVGLGVVPSTRAGRVFRDELGALNAALAAVCDEVLLLVAGLPLRLK